MQPNFPDGHVTPYHHRDYWRRVHGILVATGGAMRRVHFFRQRGFTLIETMITVMMVSILASVAIPQFSKYVRNSKKTEAYTNLRKLYDGQVAYFHEEYVTREGTAISKQFVAMENWTPEPPGEKKQFGDWEQEGWKALGFSPDGPVYFAYYTYAAFPKDEDQWFLVGAASDLNGDNWFGITERFGWYNRWAGIVEGSPALYKAEELAGVQPWDSDSEGDGDDGETGL